MNETLKKYILDPSMPLEKRQSLAKALDSGDIDEETALGGLNSKYPGKYDMPDTDEEGIPISKPESKPRGVLDNFSRFMFGDPNLSGDQRKELIQSIPGVDPVKAAGDAVNFVTEGTIKPGLKAGAGLIATGAKNLEGVWNAAKQLPDVLKKAGGDWDKQVDVEMTPDQIEQQATAPVDVPWLGNINLNRKNAEGKYDPSKSLQTAAAAGGSALIGAANVLNPLNTFGSAALRGGGQAALNEFQNEDSSTESIVAAGAIGAGASVVLQGIFNKLLKGSFSGKPKPKDVKVLAQQTGISPDKINEVLKLSPEKKDLLKSSMEKAWQNAEDPDNITSPMQDLADKVTEGMRKLHTFQKEAGGKIGEFKGDVVTGQKMMAPINVQDSRKSLLSSLAQKGVTVSKNGQLNFKGSTLENLPGDQKLLGSLWNSIKKTDNITPKQAVILREKLQGELYSGKINQSVTAAESFITDFERNLTGKIHQNNPEFADLDSVFSELKKATQAFQKKTGGSTQFTADQALDGTNTYNLLRKSLGGGNKESQVLLKKLQTLGDKYDIPELKDVLSLRRIAQLAEDVVQTDLKVSPTSMASRVASGTKGITDAMRLAPLSSATNIKQALTKDVLLEDNVKKLLQKGDTPEILKQIMETRAAQIVQENLKASIPQLFAADQAKASLPQIIARIVVDALRQSS